MVNVKLNMTVTVTEKEKEIIVKALENECLTMTSFVRQCTLKAAKKSLKENKKKE